MTLTWVRALHPMQAALVNMAQAATDAVGNVLLQYGAVGALALLGLVAVRVLFRREIEAHEYHRQRADRLEAELRQLNTTIQERYVATLAEATRAISEALAATREHKL